MSDFLSEVLNADAPVAREVKFGDKTGTVWFKRITAGQRAQVLRGQKVQTRGGEAASVEVDLGENETTRQMMVQFCVCQPDGKPFFRSIADVAKLEASKVNVLFEHVTAVNREDDAGNG